jgi:diguanylate cyclase (GGDEF)-like protein
MSLDVLVAAADSAAAAALAELLERHGLQARCLAAAAASTPAACLAALEHELPRLLLLDTSSPGLPVLELLQQLHQRPPAAELPVILHGALPTEPELERLLGAGVRDLITPETAPALLAARLRNQVQVVRQAEAMARKLLYEEAVADCARVLVGGGDLGSQLQRTVEILQRATGVSRAYVFRNEPDPELGLCARHIHEACAPGIPPEIANPLLQHVSYRDLAPAMQAHLSQGRAYAGVVQHLAEPERGILGSQGILSILTLPIVCGGEFWGFMGFDDCVTPTHWQSDEIALLQIVVEACGLAIERRRAEEEIYRIAIHDALTGLANRRYVLERLEELISEAQRGEQGFALALLDIDHFKRINDSRGHLAGDQVLRQFAALLAGECRPYDLVGRYGGEEFLVVMRHAESAQLAQRLQVLRHQLHASPLLWHGAELPIRFSAGVVASHEVGPAISARQLLELADRRLYVAKDGGRDRIVGGDQETPEEAL